MGCFLAKASAAPPPRRPPPDPPAVTTVAVAATTPPPRRRRHEPPHPRLAPSPPKSKQAELLAAGWPPWLAAVATEAIYGWSPRPAHTFEKLDKIGQGTYSSVYKAREIATGRIMALKKVRFDNKEPESVRFMAREIQILRRLDHPNVIKLEGLVTSKLSCSMYLVFEYMEHDLAGLSDNPGIRFTDPQVKCYLKQLLSGLRHCHGRGVLHRDIKGSNLLLDNNGTLKIADFGLATFFEADKRRSMTARVVTLWYRPPELILGVTEYGVGVDLWSTGCILGELLAGRPIMPGRTEVEQLHKIFKVCGSPTEEYWEKLKLPNGPIFKPQQPYKRRIRETFKGFSTSSLFLLETLLAIDPAGRQTASAALRSEFFTTLPLACEPSSLPKYPPSKEMDAKIRKEEAKRPRAPGGRATGDASKKTRIRDRAPRVAPAVMANGELQANLDRTGLIAHSNATSKNDKFPPPHQDGNLGLQGSALTPAPDPRDASNKITPPDASYKFTPSNVSYKITPPDASYKLTPSDDYKLTPPDASFKMVFPSQRTSRSNWSGPLVGPGAVARPRQKQPAHLIKPQRRNSQRLEYHRPGSDNGKSFQSKMLVLD